MTEESEQSGLNAPGQPNEQTLNSPDLSGTFLDTVMGTRAFQDITELEYKIGVEPLLEEILGKKVWSNAEMIWVLRQIMMYYGRNDELLKKAPPERIFLNMVDIIRAFYMLLDNSDPDLDENMRSYMSAKIGDATWGITGNTRIYLEKMP